MSQTAETYKQAYKETLWIMYRKNSKFIDWLKRIAEIDTETNADTAENNIQILNRQNEEIEEILKTL